MKKFDAMVKKQGWDPKRVIAVPGDMTAPSCGLTAGPGSRTHRQGPAFLPPGGDLRPDRQCRRAAGRQHRRHPPCAGPGRRAQGEVLPPRQFDRRRRPVPGRVPRGHVRRGRGPGRSLPAHQARFRRAGARGEADQVAHLPAGHGGRAFARPARWTRSTARTTSSPCSRSCARCCRRGCRRWASRAAGSTSCRSISSPTRSTTSRTSPSSTATAST